MKLALLTCRGKTRQREVILSHSRTKLIVDSHKTFETKKVNFMTSLKYLKIQGRRKKD